MPIWAVDLDGLEPWTTNDGSTITYGPYSPEFMERNGFRPMTKSDDVGESTPRLVGDMKLNEPGARKCLNCNEFVSKKMGSVTIVDVVSEIQDVGIGKAEGASSLIPVYGSGRNAISDFQNGRYISGTFNSVMLVSDAFLVTSIGKGLAKGGLKLTGSHSWNATRKHYLKEGFAKPGEPLHHWLIHRNGPIGKSIPDGVKNQMWNLKSFPNQAQHMIYGHGKNYLGREGAG